MPLQKITFRPGVTTQLSSTLNEGGWSSSTGVRFRDGLPQIVGGWISWTASALQGMARAIFAWTDLTNLNNLAIGTHQKLYVGQGNSAYDITPARRTVTLAANSVTTTNGSTSVQITDAGHGATAGDFVEISGGTWPLNNVTLSGEYTVVNVIDANNYTVTAGTTANASTAGGGTPTLVYLISPGQQDATVGFGVGGGAVGIGTVGTLRTVGGFIFHSRNWSFSNWGEWLMACLRDGPLYYWQPTGGTGTRAVAVTNGGTPANGPPLVINSALVGMPERHMILIGCSDLNASTNFDPMLIRWGDVEDTTTYNATATNSAGSFRIQGGSQTMGGLPTTGQILIWTDTTVHSMRFVGLPYVYRFDRIGTACGAISPHAFVDVAGRVLWMSPNGFFEFRGGAPTPLDCPLWTTVFSNINFAQAEKIYCALNSAWHEVTWHYPSASSMENDTTITFNYAENVWYAGLPARNCWADGDVFQYPIAVGSDSMIYQHESGTDANGAALSSSLTSGFVDLDDGTEFAFVDRIIPDFGDNFTGQVQLSVITRHEPDPTSGQVTKGPFTVTPSTKRVTFRARGRQVALTIASSTIGTFWRLGAMRANISRDGRQ